MNCLYITLFFNIVTGIVQTFIKSWNQLLYPQVIEVCHLPFEPRHDFLHLIIFVQLFPSEMFSLGEEESGNCWARGPDCTADGPIYPTLIFPYDGTHLVFGGTLDRCCHFKHLSLKESQFYHCQTSTAHR